MRCWDFAPRKKPRNKPVRETRSNRAAQNGSRGNAPCRVKGQRPLWGLGQRPNCRTCNQLREKSQVCHPRAEQRSAFSAVHKLRASADAPPARSTHHLHIVAPIGATRHHESLQIKSQAPNRTCCKEIWQKVGRKKCSTNKPPQSAGLKREKGRDVRGLLSEWWEWELLAGECPARQNKLAA